MGLLEGSSISGSLLGVGSICLLLGGLLGSVALVDPCSLGSSLLVGFGHRLSNGGLGGGVGSLVASELVSEFLLGLLLGRVECLLVLGVGGRQLGHGGLVLSVELLLVSSELEVGSLHSGSDLLTVSSGLLLGLLVGSHFLLVLGEASSRCLLCSTRLLSHLHLHGVHLSPESRVCLHGSLLGDHSFVHGHEGRGGVLGERLASSLHTTLHGLGSRTLLLVEGTSLGAEASLLLGPVLLDLSSALGGGLLGFDLAVRGLLDKLGGIPGILWDIFDGFVHFSRSRNDHQGSEKNANCAHLSRLVFPR